MKKNILFFLAVLTFIISSYNTQEVVFYDDENAQVNCLDLADTVYDSMLLQEQYYIASAAADAAYDSCVEEGGYPGDSVVTIESN
jgi:hypothetical protein